MSATVSDVRRRIVKLTLQCQAIQRDKVCMYMYIAQKYSIHAGKVMYEFCIAINVVCIVNFVE